MQSIRRTALSVAALAALFGGAITLRLDPAHAETPGKTFHAVGVVTGVDENTGVLTISHEAIPGLMSAMEMVFQTQPATLARGIHKGDRVEFTLDGKSYTVLAIRKR